MQIKTNSKFTQLGTELSADQLKLVNGGSPYYPWALYIREAATWTAHQVSNVVHDIGTAASSVVHSVVSFVSGLF